MDTDSKQAGYKYLLTYQYSSVIVDFTQEFCNRYYSGREYLRQRDQMTQAARSGKQNISEGYSLESLESYIKLLGVAKGSIMELLEDYEDYIRHHNLICWDKNSIEMRGLRSLRVVRIPFPHIPQHPHLPHNPTLVTNLMIMLCQRTTYLLTKQIQSLKDKFVNEGGFREKLFKLRIRKRKQPFNSG